MAVRAIQPRKATTINRHQAQGIEQLFPMFHGQSAQIIAYIAAKGSASAEEIRKDVRIPRSTVYKLILQLMDAGLVIRTKEEKLRIPDFSITLRNTAIFSEFRVTPHNILAFDSAHTSIGRAFIERHGLEKFAKFVDMYEMYQSGKMSSRSVARELDVPLFEIEWLLSNIESLDPSSIAYGHDHR
jgi:DNA-binding MarR family transcriptional regulator